MIKTALLATLGVMSQAAPVVPAVCEAGDIASFDWDDLMSNGNADGPEVVDFTMDVNEADLSLNIVVKLTYEGRATADDCEDAPYGTTYVLDFEDFDAHGNDIREPGTCQNRERVNFDGAAFDSLWQYSLDPADVPSVNYLAYPPAEFWTIYLEDGDCDTIVYEGHFTWNTLTTCATFGGDSMITVGENADGTEFLKGTFYTNVVGPVGADSDTGFYRVYQLISQPFLISISRNVEVLGIGGVNLLTISIIAVYKEDSESVWKLVVLTESAEYMVLTRGDTALAVFTPENGGVTLQLEDFQVGQEAENEGCLDNKQFICSQLWEITVEGTCVEGADGADGKFVDFSGEYTLAFQPSCRDDADIGAELNAYCDQWLVDHPDVNDGVNLVANLLWRDDICSVEEFEVSFEAEMIFYVDSYTTQADGSTLYQVGEDTIYIEVVTDFPDDTFNVFDTELVNVWICTFDPLTPPAMPIQPAALGGGCFDPNRDDLGNDEEPYFYHVFADGTPNGEGFVLIGHPSPNEEDRDTLRFEFTVPGCVARDKLYIHAQIEVILVNGARRRLIVGQEGSATQMNHFIESVGMHVGEPEEKPLVVHRPQQPAPVQPNTWVPPQAGGNPWIKILGGVFALILAVNVVCLCYMNCWKENVGVQRRKYKKVRVADSEEEQAINVISE